MTPNYKRCYINTRNHYFLAFNSPSSCYFFSPLVPLTIVFCLISLPALLIVVLYPPQNKQTKPSNLMPFLSFGNVKDGRVHSLCHHGMKNCPYIYICMSMNMCLRNNCIFLLVCIVKEIGTMLIQGIVIVTIVYVNPLWSYKDSHSSVKEIDMWEGAYKKLNDDFPM